MKKLLGALIAIVAVLALTIPAAAADVGTTVTIQNGGGGTAPLVKAKWEVSSDTNVENGDPSHLLPGVQIAPNMGFQATSSVLFWAVVDANNNVINHVYADVYYPATGPVDGIDANGNPATNGALKFEIPLHVWGTGDQARDLFNTAYGATGNTIVTINQVDSNSRFNGDLPTRLADLREELHQQEAVVWEGEWWFDNCELAGTYTVIINAETTSNQHGNLSNLLTWNALTAAEFDFNAVNYSANGPVAVGADVVVGGDGIWDTPIAAAPVPNKATIRNAGNTYLKMTIKQDDMGLGFTSGQGWNVIYDARLGAGAFDPVNFNPAVTKGGNLVGASATTLGQILRLCAMEKIDFSIHIVKDPVETPTDVHDYSGLMILGSIASSGPGTVGTVYNYNPITGTFAAYPTLAH